jgi:DNA-binding XRE family transcriptional regulator
MAAHNRMTIKQLAEHVGITPDSMSNKLNGKTQFKLSEMSSIQALFNSYTLDELFRQG